MAISKLLYVDRPRKLDEKAVTKERCPGLTPAFSVRSIYRATRANFPTNFPFLGLSSLLSIGWYNNGPRLLRSCYLYSLGSYTTDLEIKIPALFFNKLSYESASFPIAQRVVSRENMPLESIKMSVQTRQQLRLKWSSIPKINIYSASMHRSIILFREKI